MERAKVRHTTVSLLVAFAFLFHAGLAAGSEKALRLKKGARGDICVGCHDEFEEVLEKPYVHTPISEGDCTGCHNPHTSTNAMLLAAETGEMCLGCHDDMVPPEVQSTHQVFLEGKCISSHDPHSAEYEMNLRKPGSELCFECHEKLGEKIAENEFEHDPVTEDCLDCHNPHVSAASPNLLNDAQPALCIDCHEIDASLKAVHENYPVEKGRCTSCHDPHGSNMASILFDNVHEPVVEKECRECHGKATASAPFALNDSGFEICEGCHYDMVVDTLNKSRMHWPLLDEKGCINCHAPHASPQDSLLKEPMLLLCGRCHADTISRQERSPTEHPPIAEGACNECHSPHSSDNLFLVNESSYTVLCENCHEWQSHSTHPIGEKIIDPRNANVSLQCLSCHRTHGTEYERFLYFETTNEMCVQCHVEYRR
jgi:predicted CXXCH cytochrome family protein